MSTVTIAPAGQTFKVDITNNAGTRPSDVLTVTNKALTDNVATLTTSKAHNLAAGNTVVVAGVDAVFNGTKTVVDVPTPTTFTFAKTNANVTSAAATGTATVQATLDSDGARVMLPVEVSTDTVWTIAAPSGVWTVTVTLADGTAVSTHVIDLSTAKPARIEPIMTQAQMSAYVTTTVAAL